MKRNCPCCSFLASDLFLPPDTILSDSVADDVGGRETGEDDALLLTDMLTPQEALSQIKDASKERQRVLLVDTHGHPHLNRELNEDYNTETVIDDNTDGKVSLQKNIPDVVSLSCSVEEADWDDALKYASQSNAILPGLGVHPWYLGDMKKDWLQRLEELLVKHPHAIVGEIGLCKMARFLRTYSEGKAAALSLQRSVCKDQLKLAAKLRRPVSLHCVKQHGVFLSILKEMIQETKVNNDGNIMEAFPTAIGMHSWTGTAHHVKEILKFEETWFPKNHKLFFFGFSHSINVAMCTSDKSRKQGYDSVRAVPMDRLIVESDVHSPENVMAGTAGAIAYVSAVLNKPLLEVAEITSNNGLF